MTLHSKNNGSKLLCTSTRFSRSCASILVALLAVLGTVAQTPSASAVIKQKALSAPSKVAVTPVTGTTAKVTFNKVTNANSYTVYIYIAGTNTLATTPIKKAKPGTLIKGLKKGAKYQIAIRAISSTKKFVSSTLSKKLTFKAVALTPTPVVTPTPTPSATPTATPTVVPTLTPSATPTLAPTPTVTPTASPTPSPTTTPTPTIPDPTPPTPDPTPPTPGPTDAPISSAAIVGVTAPVTGATPTSSITATAQYTATISWNTAPVTFASATVYTATITLTPKTGYTLTGVAANYFTVAGASSVTNSINTGVITAVFGATASSTISSAAIVGVTAPVTGATPTSSITATAQYTATISWNTAPVTFASATVYTATITLTPKTGYTLSGVTANYFTVVGASTTNLVNSGIVTAVFPSTSATVVTTAAIAGVTAPVRGATPVTTVTSTAQFTGSVVWSTGPVTFAGAVAYTATITLVPTSGFTFTGVAANYFTVAGASSVTNSSNTGVISAVFPATAAAVISTAAIAGVTAPVRGATPVTTITPTAQYTGTISWSGSPVTFAASTSYTATITLTALSGYTLSGVAANFFTVTGATPVTNTINAGVITAVFPATAAAIISTAAIAGVTAPVRGATPVTTITPTVQYTGTISWSGSPVTYAGGVAYTATITLTALSGYTLTGVAANFFTVTGATPVTNTINTGVISAVFPATIAIVNPTITSIDHISGSRLGGTVLAFTGTGFVNGASVIIGGAVATSVSVNSLTSITATTAAHAIGLVDVVVTNSDTGFGTGTGAGAGGFEYVGALCNDTFTCQVGDIGAGGGTIFYVAPTTFTSLGSLCSDSCKYLEFAPSTWSGGVGDPLIYWQDSGRGVENISGTTSAIGSGMFDSLLISNQTTTPDPSKVAAKVALSYPGVGTSSAGDWYLPSPAEFNELVNSGLASSGNFNVATGIYWTSLQNDISTACIYGFAGGGAFINGVLKGNRELVRPFRAFGAVKPAAPAAGSVSILTPVIGEHPGQTLLSMSSSMEYKILSADGSAVKQDWTGISASFATSASPALLAGDLIIVRYLAASPDAHSSDYIYTVQSSDIGEAAPAPAITSLDVTSGTRLGSTTVVITGTNFVTGAQVTFGGTAASVTFNSATQLTAVTGAHAFGLVNVVVTNPDLGSDTNTSGFEYLGALCNDTFTCQVGDIGPGGGIIFAAVPSLFTSPGSTCSDTCKYLEYAPLGWNGAGNDTTTFISSDHSRAFGRTGTSLGDGLPNTIVMMTPTGSYSGDSDQAASQSINYAASDGSVGQWYLPSIAELSLLSASGAVAIGGFANNFYWSSSADFSYIQVENPQNSELGNVQNSGSYYVRPIRAFNTKPAAPLSGAVHVTKPLIDAAPGQVSIATDAGIEYQITDSSANEKQPWTDGGSAATTLSTPNVVAGDLIHFRVKAAGSTGAGFIMTYTVLTGDIGQATPIAANTIYSNSLGTSISIYYGASMSRDTSNLQTSDFSLTVNGGAPINPSSFNLASDGLGINLLFSTPFIYDDTLTLSYTRTAGHELQTTSGTWAAEFSNSVVTNNVPNVAIATTSPLTISVGALPVVIRITGAGTTLAFNSGVSLTDFIIEAGGTGLSATGISYVPLDQSVEITFAAPSGALGGVVTIQAKPSAYSMVPDISSNVLGFTVGA